MENDMQHILTAIKKLEQPKNRPLIIAISGYGGSGKSTLAAKLKEQLGNTEVIAADDFIISRCKDRTADWSSYDRPRLQSQVLEPALSGEPIRYQSYDWKNDKLGEWRTALRTSYLIAEGLSILHPDLRKYYDLKIWVDCPLDIATQRGIKRDQAWGNDHDDPWLNIWMPNERDFMAKYRPDLAADIKFNTN
jgi:uridine kinase